jgi:hypothetical protein
MLAEGCVPAAGGCLAGSGGRQQSLADSTGGAIG